MSQSHSLLAVVFSLCMCAFLAPVWLCILVLVLVAVLYNPHGSHVFHIKSVCHCHLQGSDCQGQGLAAHGCHVISPDRLGYCHPQQAGAAWNSTPHLPGGTGGKLETKSRNDGLGYDGVATQDADLEGLHV